MLVASCTSGLCNRTHCLLGSKIIADELGRDFKVYWPRNSELDANFQDLFDTSIKDISQDELNYLVSDSRVTCKIYNAGLQESVNIHRDDHHDIIVVKSWTAPLFVGEQHNHSYKNLLEKHLAILPFKREITQRAEPSRYASHVGVHIRYGDYRPDGQNHLEYFSRASEGAFRSIMSRVIQLRPGTRFYLSCPNEQIKKSLASSFDVDFVSINPYRSMEGIQDAIVDLTNLSGCAFVFGSSPSQFSQFVGLMYHKFVGMIGGAGGNHELVCGPLSVESTEEAMLSYAFEQLDSRVTQ